MEKELFEDIADSVEYLYSNLFLIAIDKGYDLRAVVKEASEEVAKYNDRNKKNIPRGFDGILFVSTVTKIMGTSIFDALYMKEVEKKLIAYKLVEDFDYVTLEINDYGYDEDKDITTIDCTYTYYDIHAVRDDMSIVLRKQPGRGDGYIYSVEGSFDKNYDRLNDETDVMYNSVAIWSEEKGKVADFIQETIEMNRNAKTSRENEDLKEGNAESFTESDNDVKEEIQSTGSEEKIIVGHKKVGEIDEKTGKIIIDELVTSISDDTRTISLLDTFEGYEKGQPAYQRIVVKNTDYGFMLGLKNRAGLNLVIERSRNSDYVGDITFTEYKQGKTHDLCEFLKQEINDEIAEKYLNRDEFYRFSKPYHLRAQNSRNRTGYGWEWDWSGGYGDYTEGTLYGETTDYVFVGAYISSAFSLYDPTRRRPFGEDQSVVVSTEKENSVKIVIYKGKKPYIPGKTLLDRYMKVQRIGKPKYLPVLFDKQGRRLYVSENIYLKYKNKLKGEMLLLKQTAVQAKNNNSGSKVNLLETKEVKQDLKHDKNDTYLDIQHPDLPRSDRILYRYSVKKASEDRVECEKIRNAVDWMLAHFGEKEFSFVFFVENKEDKDYIEVLILKNGREFRQYEFQGKKDPVARKFY